MSRPRDGGILKRVVRHSIKYFYGNKVGASDGDIGTVQDFFFDDQNWAIRYLVVDTGAWLPKRNVLISPYSLGLLQPNGKAFAVDLKRQQIERSPLLDGRKGVSRAEEEKLHRYYGWPFYWEGKGLWGASDFPILELPVANTLLREAIVPHGPDFTAANFHLFSTQAVEGFSIEASDGAMGYICDFMVDEETWALVELVIKIGHRYSGSEVLVPVTEVTRISREHSTVHLGLTTEAIRKSNAHKAPAVASTA